jgi:hypothetical protein
MSQNKIVVEIQSNHQGAEAKGDLTFGSVEVQ